MMRLYHGPRSRSQRILWLLEEIGEPYEICLVADRKAPEHVARHPLGKVPVLEVEGGFLFETSAIALYLGDRFPAVGLLPQPGTYERGLAFQWISYCATEIEPSLLGMVAARRADEPDRAETALGGFHTGALVVERLLADQPYLLGERFSVADVVLTGILVGGRNHEALGGLPALQAYLEEQDRRPARRRALEIDDV
jgi:glutathione S-transferase